MKNFDYKQEKYGIIYAYLLIDLKRGKSNG